MLFFINNIYIHILNLYYYIKYAYRIQSQTSAIWAHKRRTHAMRSHLKECFEKQKMDPFPVKKKSRVNNTIFKEVTMFICPKCKMPDN